MRTIVTGGDLCREALKETSKVTERVMMEQLNELVSRGIIRWEQGEQEISQIFDPVSDQYRLVISFKGRLVCREQEYILKLEDEVKQLQNFIQYLQKRIQDESKTRE